MLEEDKDFDGNKRTKSNSSEEKIDVFKKININKHNFQGENQLSPEAREAFKQLR